VKRLCIYAHYDKNQIIDDYVIYQLRYYSLFFDKIIFVSTSCNPFELSKLRGITTHNMIRENTGYDFMSWKTGLDAETDLNSFNELVLTNDSVYGPIFSLEDLFKKMAEVPCDFWSPTENIEVKPHLQSYFLVFKKNVFSSPAFKEWMESFKSLENKKDYVTKFEVALTERLKEAGFVSAVSFKSTFSMAAVAYSAAQSFKSAVVKNSPNVLEQVQEKSSYSKIRRWITPNPTLRQWRKLIKARSPFVKVQIFRENPLGENLEDAKKFLKEQSTYPIYMIESHASRTR